jgi:hypothetical protein
MLQRLWLVLAQPACEKLRGRVEADETGYGGKEVGLRDGRAVGKKRLVGVAVEVDDAGVLERCRMGLLRDASAHSGRSWGATLSLVQALAVGYASGCGWGGASSGVHG